MDDDSTVAAVCERCGSPAEYDSDYILCDSCFEQHQQSHTPGPWQITKNGDVDFSIHLDDLSLIAQVGDGPHDGAPGQAEANARLIATAPDLLEAANAVLGTWEHGDLVAAMRKLQSAANLAVDV